MSALRQKTLIVGAGAAFSTLKEILIGVAAAWALIKLQTILATAWANTYALTTGAVGGAQAVLMTIRAAWLAVTTATLEATAAMLANPFTLIAIAVGALIFAMQRYIDKVNEAWDHGRRRRGGIRSRGRGRLASLNVTNPGWPEPAGTLGGRKATTGTSVAAPLDARVSDGNGLRMPTKTTTTVEELEPDPVQIEILVTLKQIARRLAAG